MEEMILLLALWGLGEGLWAQTPTASDLHSPSATEAVGNMINSYIEQMNEINQSDQVRCSRQGSAINECRAINGYPRPNSTPLAMDGGPETELCSHHWQADGINLRQMGNQCKSQLDRFSSNYVPPSVKDMAAQGFTSVVPVPPTTTAPAHSTSPPVLSPSTKSPPVQELIEKRKVIFARAKQLQAKVASACCNGDPECQKSFTRLEISMCEPPKNPNAEDPCARGAGHTIPALQSSQMWNHLYLHYFKDSTRAQTAQLEPIREVIQSFYTPLRTLNQIPYAMAGATIPLPVPGKITLSPYVRLKKTENIYYQDTWQSTVVHELFHACDIIKAQQNALSDQDPVRALAGLTRLRRSYLSTEEGRCTLKPPSTTHMRLLWKSLGESEDLALCLEKVLDHTTQPQHLNFCKDTCHNYYQHELFAQAAEVLFLEEDLFPSAYPLKSCFGFQDIEHPLGVNVLECLAQNSATFRRNFKKVFRCDQK